MKAWHTNYPWYGSPTQIVFQLLAPPTARSGPPPALTSGPLIYLKNLVKPYSARNKQGFERNTWFNTKGRGYQAEQATKPQTLGYSLADSPVGLLAWVYEKLVTWTDDYAWGDDEGITIVILFWATV